VIQGSDDRLFPLEFQRQVVRARLGLELEVMCRADNLMALSRPEELSARIRRVRVMSMDIERILCGDAHRRDRRCIANRPGPATRCGAT
jgi:hypothetical protein